MEPKRSVHRLSMTVNRQRIEVEVEPHQTLLEVLRDQLGLHGVKEGCGTGECGACTVLAGGQPVNSCLMLALEAEEEEILTIESLAPDGSLHPLQKAFIEHGAVQCGFCTPGMLLSAMALLQRTADPSESEIRHALSGNLCRCTGYDKIVRAVEAAAGEMRNESV
jgi:carbon-monoxide dehydrogenase small subunit